MLRGPHPDPVIADMPPEPSASPPERDALTETEARERAAAVSAVHYEISLDLGDGTGDYSGRARIRFACPRPGPGPGLFLDFTGRDVDLLRVNGAAADAAARTRHRIPIEASLLRGENVVEVSWRNDFDRTGVGLHRFRDPEDGAIYLFTDFEPFNAHRVFPCFDQPDIKATYDLDVVAPDGWAVIASGEETAREAAGDGRSRRRFARLPRFSTYLFAVVAGPYVSVNSHHGAIRLGVHCRKSLRPFLDPDEIFEITRQGMDFYSGLFGVPYAFGKYDQIFVPEFNSGAMENVGAVTFNEVQVFRDPPTETQRLHRAEVVLHELAHMWFGNLVTMRWWDDLWLNESFATYISFLAMSEATRFKACWQDFLGSIKTWACREDLKPTTHPIAGSVADTEQTFLNFDGITYGKGASVLKQLRAVVGGEAFAAGLRIYFRRHAFGNTTLPDFLAALSEGSGQDLVAWSKLWLETSGINDLVPESAPGGGIRLRQVPGNGDARLRPHTLDAALLRPDPEGRLKPAKTLRIRVDGAATPLPGFEDRGPADLVWCNLGDHAYARVLLDPGSLERARQDLGRVADPLTRQGLWGTLWEMLREGSLPPPAYLDLVRRHLVRESEPELIESVLRNAALALVRYVSPSAQPAEGARLLSAAEEALAAHPARSDPQRVWARAMPGFVSDAAQAASLASWLERGAPAGAEVDQGMRWRILVRARAFGLDDDGRRLEQEARRDASDRGVKSRYAAEVALGSAATKSGAFDAFCRPGTRSADHLKHGMGAFWWPHQAALLLPYAVRYFDALPGVLAAEDLEYVARGFVRIFFPHAVAGPEVLGAAESLLAGLGPGQAVLRRFLLEETDELRRTHKLRGTGAAG